MNVLGNKKNEKSSDIMHLFTGMALYVRDESPFSYAYWYLFHRLSNDWGSVDSFKTVIYYMRDSQADLQAVGDFLDKSMKLVTNVVQYLSYKFIPRTNLSNPILAAILHHIQQFPYDMLKAEI